MSPPTMPLPIRLWLAVVLTWGAVRLTESIAPLHRGWTPADLAAVDGPATALLMASVRDDPRWCRAVLAGARVGFTAVPDRDAGGGCGWRGAMRLTGAEWRPRGTVVACPLAVALDVWRTRVVAPAVVATGARLAGFDHYGSYSCRVIAGTDRQSEHARANAIDVAALRLAGGGTIGVARDWRGDGPRARLLRRIHDGGCGLFGTVLGPDYNAAHRDHIHLDMAGWSYCR